MAHVTIEGRALDLHKKLSGRVRQQAININVVDEKICRLQVQCRFSKLTMVSSA